MLGIGIVLSPFVIVAVKLIEYLNTKIKLNKQQLEKDQEDSNDKKNEDIF